MDIKHQNCFNKQLSLVDRVAVLCCFVLFFHLQVSTGQWGGRRRGPKGAKLCAAVPARHDPRPDSLHRRFSGSDQLHAGLWLAGGHHGAGVGLPEGGGLPDCTAARQKDSGGTWHGDDNHPGGVSRRLSEDCLDVALNWPLFYVTIQINWPFLQIVMCNVVYLALFI